MSTQQGSNSISQTKSLGSNLLKMAIESSNIYTVRTLLEVKDVLDVINEPDENGVTPFLSAISRGDLEMAKLLVSSGANPHLANNQGYNAYFLAMSKTNLDLGVFDYLFTQAKVNINHVSQIGETPLAYAIIHSNLAAAKKLIELGADPMQPTHDGFTPLDMASYYGYSELITQLEQGEKQLEQHKLKTYNEYKNYCEKCRMVKFSAGHALGLSTTFPIFHPKLNKEVDIKTEEGLSFYSADMLNKYLQDYLNLNINQALQENKLDKEVKDKFEAIQHAVELEKNYLYHRSPEELKKLADSAQRSDVLTFIPCGWNGHDIAVGRMGPFLLVTNRGEGKLETGTMIYKLKDDVKFDEKTILSLLPLGNRLSMKTIQDVIFGLIDPEYVGIPVASSPQKRGNCSFANRKSNEEPALLAMKLCELDKKSLDEILSTLKVGTIAPKNNESAVVFESNKKMIHDEAIAHLKLNRNFREAQQFAEKHYKRHTKFIRDNQIENFIKEFTEAKKSGHGDKETLYRQIFVKYLQEHAGKPITKPVRGEVQKPKAELSRAEKILSSLEKDDREQLLLALKQGGRPNNIRSQLLANARKYGFYHLFKLIDPNYNPNLLSLNGRTLLMEAVESNDEAMVKQVLSDFPTSDPNRLGKTIESATKIAQNNQAITKILLAHRKSIEPLINKRNEAFKIILESTSKTWAENKTRLLEIMREGVDIFYASIEEGGIKPHTPLTLAINRIGKDPQMGQEITLWLLQQGDFQSFDRINEPDGQGWTPLMLACRLGNLELCKRLIAKGASIHKMDIRGNNLLGIAAFYGHRDIIEYLLDTVKLNIDVRNYSQWSALTHAVSKGNLDLANFLIEKGANVKFLDIGMQSLVSIACRSNKPEMVHLLLENKQINEMLETYIDLCLDAIVAALSNKNFGLAQELLKYAPVYDAKQVSLLESAVSFNQSDVVRFLLNQQSIQEYMRNSVSYGFSALVQAFNRQSKELIDLLLANIPAIDVNGDNLIIEIVTSGKSDLLKLALSEPRILATLNNIQDGKTALHVAAAQGNHEMVELLLKARANPLIPDASGATADKYASENGFSALVLQIKEAQVQAKAEVQVNAQVQAKDQNQLSEFERMTNSMIYGIAEPLAIRVDLRVRHPMSRNMQTAPTQRGLLQPTLQSMVEILEACITKKEMSENEVQFLDLIRNSLKLEFDTLNNPKLSQLLQRLNDAKETLLTFLPFKALGERGALAVVGKKGLGRFLVLSSVAPHSHEVNTNIYKLKDDLQWNDQLLQNLAQSNIGEDDLNNKLLPLVEEGTSPFFITSSPWEPGMESYWNHFDCIRGVRFLQSMLALPEKDFKEITSLFKSKLPKHISEEQYSALQQQSQQAAQSYMHGFFLTKLLSNTIYQRLRQEATVEHINLGKLMQEESFDRLFVGIQEAMKQNAELKIVDKQNTEIILENYLKIAAAYFFEQYLLIKNHDARSPLYDPKQSLQRFAKILTMLDENNKAKLLKQLASRATIENITLDYLEIAHEFRIKELPALLGNYFQTEGVEKVKPVIFRPKSIGEQTAAQPEAPILSPKSPKIPKSPKPPTTPKHSPKGHPKQ